MHDLHDQFAYKPSGSTTSALIAVNHYVAHLLESHSYFWCISLDFSKAFDTINHPILFQKLQKLNLPANILLWICRFLIDRVQAVDVGGSMSNWMPINQSIVQGSGLGPYLCIIYAADQKPLPYGLSNHPKNLPMPDHYLVLTCCFIITILHVSVDY